MEVIIENRQSGVTPEGVPWDSMTIRPMTEEEIRIEKILDQMNLERLEEELFIQNEQGYETKPARTFHNEPVVLADELD